MDDFGFSATLRKREQEQAKRRENLRKQIQEKAAQVAEAHRRTDALVQESISIKRDKELQQEIHRIRDQGASNNGVAFERALELVLSDHLRPDSDRVLLPVDVLSELSGDPNLAYPMLFEVYDPSSGKRTHCGVLEFSAEEGQILVPAKVFHSLGGDVREVRLRYKVLPKCTHMSLKVPESVYGLFPDFRSFLESSIRTQYATMTVGDKLIVGGQVPIFADSLQPESAVCVIDADVNLDLIVVDDEGSDSKWSVGSSMRFTVLNGKTVQKRLTVGPIQIQRIRVSSNSRVDMFVSLPPLVEADLNSFDLMASFDESESSVSLEVDRSILLRRGLETWPQFIIIGVACASDISEVTVSAQPVLETAVESSSSDSVECSNCASLIPSRSRDLHFIHCQARYQLCSTCRKPVKRADMAQHTHCEVCNRAVGYDHLEKHREQWHEPLACLCGRKVTRDELPRHRRESCSNRLVLCRFCACWGPVGDLSRMDARDRMMGFVSEHEAACGNRTEVCPLCTRRERLKDMQFHNQAYHS